MSEKIKPEHRKLWRRIYLDEFEGCGASPEDASAMADKVVAQWDARGAFDEPVDTAEPAKTPTSGNFAQPFGVVFPGDLEHAFRLVMTYHLCDDIVVAAAKEPDSYMLIAWSERGKHLVCLAMNEGFANMLDRVKSDARAAANAAVLRTAAKNAPTVA